MFLRSIMTVSGLTFISRIFGFVRDILIAAVLGAGLFADAFFVAFKLPNLFRRLFAEGAFSSAFIPIYGGLLEESGEESAREFANQALSVLFFTLLCLVIIFEICMPWIMLGFAPGFINDSAKFELTVLLTRITFPYLLFISIVSLMAGLLNTVGRFAAAASTPILLNISLIGAITIITPLLPSPAHALSWGVFIAGVLQLIWMIIFCFRSGIYLRISFPKLTPSVYRLAKRIIPVAIGAGIYQINLVIDMIIASLLPLGSISYLFFSDRVTQLPLGIIGIAIGTVLLPLLTRQLHSSDFKGAIKSQNHALEISFLLTIPASIGLIILADLAIAALFGRGAFGAFEVFSTGSALQAYAYGLPAYVIIKVLSPGFFARDDTKTPVVISCICMALNLVLNLILMGPFLHVGIALATAFSSWVNAGVMAYILHKRGHLVIDTHTIKRMLKILASAIGMGFLLFYGMDFLIKSSVFLGQSHIVLLIIMILLGLISFFGLSFLCGGARLEDLKKLL